MEGRRTNNLFLMRNSLFSFSLLAAQGFNWLVKKKVVDFRWTAVWHSLRPGLMPGWVSMALKGLVGESEWEGRKREASEIK